MAVTYTTLQPDYIAYGSKRVECVGKHCIKYFKLLSADNSHGIQEDFSSENFNSLLGDENDYVYLRSLDPREWKDQDHYAVLGLQDKRFEASLAEIKTAYRQKVLRHHPDKRRANGEIINRDDDYYTCITKAWEILGDRLKRRSYDSVDPYFDNEIPSNTEFNRNSFFQVFGEAFKANSRWSEKKPVPLLGGPEDQREVVEEFYNFWYNFESWREYSYEDEESKDRAQDRDERKWIEKQNKAVRAKKKKEEMARIRSLVDIAYSLDPRIAKFKLEEKVKKEAQKKAKAEAIRARQEEIEKLQLEKEEKERRQREEEEAAEKAKQDALRAERELQKKKLRKAKKLLRDYCKENDYFTTSSEEAVVHMEYLEKMCDVFGLKELEQFNEELKQKGKESFIKKLKELENKLQQERQNLILSNQKQDMDSIGESNYSLKSWPQSHINLLIKAVNLFPAGTNQRWEVVANFINQHSKNGVCLTAKEVLSKAKDLQANDTFSHQLKKAANCKAYETFQTGKKHSSGVDEMEASQRFDSIAEQLGLGPPWTSEEQQLLEQALKTYPSNTLDRWDQIASCIPSRSKKDCMKRYKELVEMVKAKKAATQTMKIK